MFVYDAMIDFPQSNFMYDKPQPIISSEIYIV